MAIDHDKEHAGKAGSTGSSILTQNGFSGVEEGGIILYTFFSGNKSVIMNTIGHHYTTGWPLETHLSVCPPFLHLTSCSLHEC